VLLHIRSAELEAVFDGSVCCECCFTYSASDQSPLTIVSSSSPEPTLEPHSGHDDITNFKTWVKFLPDFEARAKERLSPEIPLICPTPVKGVY